MKEKGYTTVPLNKRVEAKISEGDIRGATKLMFSDWWNNTSAFKEPHTFLDVRRKPKKHKTMRR